MRPYPPKGPKSCPLARHEPLVDIRKFATSRIVLFILAVQSPFCAPRKASFFLPCLQFLFRDGSRSFARPCKRVLTGDGDWSISAPFARTGNFFDSSSQKIPVTFEANFPHEYIVRRRGRSPLNKQNFSPQDCPILLFHICRNHRNL